MEYQGILKTKLGNIVIKEENGCIIKLYFEKEEKAEPTKETLLITKTKKELLEYLEGKRKEFDIPVQTKGTPFQEKVWSALKQIPYGQTKSYQEIADIIGNPKAVRAVGMANHRNPVGILIPCHRVIGKNGKLVGYAGGLSKKEALLELEKRYQ